MKRLIVICITVLLVILAACNAEVDSSQYEKKKETGEADKAALIDASGTEITYDKKPETFAALSSGDLDILLALDAEISGRPSSDHPPEKAKAALEIGNPHQPNFENLAAAQPDMLITGLSFQQHAKNVESQGTQVVYTAANSVKDIQDTISLVGELTEKSEKADEINQNIDTKIEEAKANQAEDPVRTLLVYGAPGTFLAALPNSLTGDILEIAGGENIASDFEEDDSYPQYASLSIEKIVERDPEVIMLITHGEPETVKEAFEKEMKQKAAWKNLDAVKNGHVIILSSELFGTNPGTKVVDAISEIEDHLKKVH